MSLVTINGTRVIGGTIERPLSGAWTADLDLDVADVPAGSVTIAGGGLSVVGTVVRGRELADRIAVRVVGGAGGLGKTLPAQFYRSATVRSVLVTTLAAAGERLSATSDASFTDRTLDAWQRAEGTAADALNALCRRVPGTVWRVLADGSIWVGTPSWSTRALDYVQVDEDLAGGRVDAATDDLALDAGVTVEGRKLGRVRYTFEADSIRVSWWVADGATLDRFKGAVLGLIESVFARRVDYLAAHPGKVVTQHGDGTLDIVPDNKRLKPMTKVRIHYGVPGVTAKVSPGARVMVEFSGGDPERPFATVWESASVTEVSVNAAQVKLAGGARPVACEGDLVTVVLTSAHVAAASGGAPTPVSGYILKCPNKTSSS